jgi:hypothetical protein
MIQLDIANNMQEVQSGVIQDFRSVGFLRKFKKNFVIKRGGNLLNHEHNPMNSVGVYYLRAETTYLCAQTMIYISYNYK